MGSYFGAAVPCLRSWTRTLVIYDYYCAMLLRRYAASTDFSATCDDAAIRRLAGGLARRCVGRIARKVNGGQARPLNEKIPSSCAVALLHQNLPVLSLEAPHAAVFPNLCAHDSSDNCEAGRGWFHRATASNTPRSIIPTRRSDASWTSVAPHLVGPGHRAHQIVAGLVLGVRSLRRNSFGHQPASLPGESVECPLESS